MFIALATPTINYTNTIPVIVTEEGEDILIKCPFSDSPLDDYIITLQENKAGNINMKQTLETDNSNNLLITNVTQYDSGMYFCQLIDRNSAIYIGPEFKIEVNTKYSELFTQIDYVIITHL